MKSKKYIFISLCFLWSIYSCENSTAKEEAIEAEQTETISPEDETEVSVTEVQYKNAEIQIGELEDKVISEVLKANGTIDVPPQNLVSVSIQLGGYVKSTRLLPGTYVEKGQVLASIEDQQYIQLQQDYLTAKTQLSFAESDYKRQQELRPSGATSEKSLQQAKSQRDYQQVMVNSLAQKLKMININPNKLSAGSIQSTVPVYSPISGYVAKVNVNVGKYITPTDVLFDILNPSEIYLNLKIYQDDIQSLKIGQKITAYNNVNPNKKYSCTIVLINKDISVNGVVEVRCKFDDYDADLLPGMYMNAEVEVEKSSQKVLPEEAFVSFESEKFVFVQIGEREFKMTPVEAGITNDNYTTVQNPEALEGKKIVVKGAYALLMKMKNLEEE